MEKYLHYTFIDFVEDESFLRWLNNSPKTDDLDWDSWLNENPMKKDEIEKAKLFVGNIKFKENHINESIENSIWEKIDNNISNDKVVINKERVKLFKFRPYIIAAASIAILIFAGSILFNSNTSYETLIAEQKKVTLPDGSIVQLNANSELSFKTKNWEKDRSVNLKGEAFFEVKKGSRFSVLTEKGNVEVLGTSFNVYVRDQTFNVSCKTGKVRIVTNNIQQILMPNQAIENYNDKSNFIKDVAENNERSSWLKGVYKYDNEKLRNVLDELERQLGYTFQISDKDIKQNFTGSFNTNNNKNAISEVLWPLGLEYTFDGRNVIISEK